MPLSLGGLSLRFLGMAWAAKHLQVPEVVGPALVLRNDVVAIAGHSDPMRGKASLADALISLQHLRP